MQPSRARYRVLAFTTILAIITYLDRVAISSAAPAVRSEMGLDAVQMGWVFSAFTWAMPRSKSRAAGWAT
jgi:sugar phosphate permease